MSTDELYRRSAAVPALHRRALRIRGRTRTRLRPDWETHGGRLGFDAVLWVVLIDCAALVGAYAVIPWINPSSMVLLVGLVLAVNTAGGHYRPLVAPSLLDELPGLGGRALVAGAITTVVSMYLAPSVGAGPTLTAIAYLAFACGGRMLGYPLLNRWRAVHKTGRPTIIVGCGLVGDQIAATLLERPEYGMRPVGFVDDEASLWTSDRQVPVLGGLASLPHLIREHLVCDVIVTVSADTESGLVDVLRSCDRLAGEIFVLPRLHELHGADAGASIWSFPLTRLRRASHRSLSWRLKRIFDVVAAACGLVLLSPLFALCAIGVYIEGGRGIIFRQERVGLDGRTFMILKFRSLAPATTAESEQRWSITADPRLGPVGRLLRTLSLDELPQLWNVVRGDMSLVGPRPERPFFVNEFTQRIPYYAARHRVPAGLTGWAQISGLRGDTDISERARFDNYYIQNWSLWSDVKIILRTVGKVVSRSGA